MRVILPESVISMANETREDGTPSRDNFNHGLKEKHRYIIDNQPIVAVERMEMDCNAVAEAAISPDAQLCKQGNELIHKGNFSAAMVCYSKALDINPSNPTYFFNRALCETELKRWEGAIDDCQYALSFDETNVKVHVLLGKSLSEMGDLKCINKALAHLEIASSLAKTQGRNFGNGIADAIDACSEKKRALLDAVVKPTKP